MPVPVVWDPGRRIARIAELEAPDALDLDRSHRKLGLDTAPLKLLYEGDAVKDKRSWQVDRVDAAPLA